MKTPFNSIVDPMKSGHNLTPASGGANITNGASGFGGLATEIQQV